MRRAVVGVVLRRNSLVISVDVSGQVKRPRWSQRIDEIGSSFCSRYHTERFISSTSAKSSSNSEIENEKGENKRKKGGIPWGFLVTVAFIGSIVGYFYRGHKNGKRLKKMENEIRHESALAPDETEEIRGGNLMGVQTFEILRMNLRKRYDGEVVKPSEFFQTCEKLVRTPAKQLEAQHLFERLAISMEDSKERYPLVTLLTAMSMCVESSIEDLVAVLFRVYTNSGKGAMKTEKLLRHEDFVSCVEDLRITNQLPVRANIREISHYPFNEYERANAEYLVTRAVEEITKQRKRRITGGFFQRMVSPSVTLPEDEYVSILKKRQQLKDDAPSDVTSAPEMPRDPIWSLEDFQELLLSKSICAWGECFNNKEM